MCASPPPRSEHGPVRAALTILRVLAHTIPTLVGIVVITFLLLQLAPGDAVDVLAGEAGAATAETMAGLRSAMGLDLPVLDQLAAHLVGLARFDFGWSVRYNAPVIDIVMERLPSTLMLMGSALALALVIGVLLGTLMACTAGTWIDRSLSAVILVFYSVPGFWIGLMFIVFFGLRLGLLPTGGQETIGADLAGWAGFADKARHMVLPAAAMALFFIAIYARLMRTSTLQVLAQDHVRVAAAKGLSRRAVVARHVLRNAILPVTTMAGVHIGAMVGGAIVIETVFSWPGLGRLAYEALMSRDFKILLAVLFLSSIFVMFTNAMVDLLQMWLDPRIRGRR